MGVVPGKIYESTFSISYQGTLAKVDALPVVQIFHRNSFLADAIEVQVTPLIDGVFGYSFNAPVEWKHGDRVALFVSYIHKGVHKNFHLPVDSVTWDMDTLDFLGFSKHMPMTITDTVADSILELPDGRKLVVLIQDQGARKATSRQDVNPD